MADSFCVIGRKVQREQCSVCCCWDRMAGDTKRGEVAYKTNDTTGRLYEADVNIKASSTTPRLEHYPGSSKESPAPNRAAPPHLSILGQAHGSKKSKGASYVGPSVANSS